VWLEQGNRSVERQKLGENEEEAPKDTDFSFLKTDCLETCHISPQSLGLGPRVHISCPQIAGDETSFL
jgi:hypothetical protein